MLLCPSSTRAGVPFWNELQKSSSLTKLYPCGGSVGGRSSSSAAGSKLYPGGFCDDLVRVMRDREFGVRIEQIARDFGVHPMMLQKWMCCAGIDEGARPGQTRTESVELREARERVRLLEQGNEVFRWAAGYLLQANLPGKGGTRS